MKNTNIQAQIGSIVFNKLTQGITINTPKHGTIK